MTNVRPSSSIRKWSRDGGAGFIIPLEATWLAWAVTTFFLSPGELLLTGTDVVLLATTVDGLGGG